MYLQSFLFFLIKLVGKSFESCVLSETILAFSAAVNVISSYIFPPASILKASLNLDVCLLFLIASCVSNISSILVPLYKSLFSCSCFFLSSSLFVASIVILFILSGIKPCKYAPKFTGFTMLASPSISLATTFLGIGLFSSLFFSTIASNSVSVNKGLYVLERSDAIAKTSVIQSSCDTTKSLSACHFLSLTIIAPALLIIKSPCKLLIFLGLFTLAIIKSCISLFLADTSGPKPIIFLASIEVSPGDLDINVALSSIILISL